MKKINRDLFILFFALIIAIAGICAHEMKNYYAELVFNDNKGKNDCCDVILNGKEKYIPLPEYCIRREPDTSIRYGKNPITALTNEDFDLYLCDEEYTFIFCNEYFFGLYVDGLYIKDGEQNKFFKPTKENIQKVIITGDYKEVLIITHEDEVCFDRFLKKYKKQLEDYTYKLNFDDDADFENKQYGVDIYYGDGDISRFFGYISEKEFNEIRKNYHLSKTAES